MIITIAWKNIWRNPIRSLAVIGAVSLGLWAGAYMISFANGMNSQRLKEQLNTSIGHIKITHPKFNEDKLVEFFLENPDSIGQAVSEYPEVKAYTSRLNCYGMASSAAGSFGVDIYGVDTVQETKVFAIYQRVQEGDFLPSSKRNPIVIGARLAKRLKLKVRSKVVLSFQDVKGEIIAGAFRVSGIYALDNKGYEESHVFLRKSDLQDLLGISEGAAHQLVFKLHNPHAAEGLSQQIQEKSSIFLSEDWKQISPELGYIDEVMVYFFLIFIGIILFALSMGILNTMLMAVLERTRELGMLRAIGMSRAKVFLMIMWETLFLTATGLPIGLGLAWLSITISYSLGIDLSVVGEGFEAIGYSSFIRPKMDFHEYVGISVMVFIAALLSSLYPAWTALKLKPAEAIRKI